MRKARREQISRLGSPVRACTTNQLPLARLFTICVIFRLRLSLRLVSFFQFLENDCFHSARLRELVLRIWPLSSDFLRYIFVVFFWIIRFRLQVFRYQFFQFCLSMWSSNKKRNYIYKPTYTVYTKKALILKKWLYHFRGTMAQAKGIRRPKDFHEEILTNFLS